MLPARPDAVANGFGIEQRVLQCIWCADVGLLRARSHREADARVECRRDRSASTLPAAASSLRAGGPSRIMSAKVPPLILATAGPVPRTVIVTFWPVARSKGAARSRRMYSTAPVVIRLISAARPVSAAMRQLTANATTVDHGRMASSRYGCGE